MGPEEPSAEVAEPAAAAEELFPELFPEIRHRSEVIETVADGHVSLRRLVGYCENPEIPTLDGLEQFAVISTFLAAFVVADLVNFDFSSWPAPVLAEAYLVLMSFTVGNIIFCSVLSVTVLLSARRVLDWDLELACGIRRKHQTRVIARKEAVDICIKDDQETVITAVRYAKTLPFPLPPWPLPSTYFARRREDVIDALLSNGSEWVIVNEYCFNGPVKTHGFRLFPLAVLSYLVAVCLAVLKNHLVPWHVGAEWDLPAFFISGSLADGFTVEDGYDPEPAAHGWISIIVVPVILLLYFGGPMAFFASCLLGVIR